MKYVSSENLKTYSTKLNTILNTKVSINPQSLTTAQQLQARKNIGLGNVDNTSDAEKQVYEANLQWGGKNLAATFSPVDAAMIPELGANRFAYLKPEGVEIEYSRDAGATWVDYGLTDAQKKEFFSPRGRELYIGGDNSVGINKTNYQLRITITSDLVGIYTQLNKFAIFINSIGSTKCWCSIDVQTKANADAGNDVWESRADKVHIEGWSGWNIINIKPTTTYSNASIQYQKWRFTFGVGSHETESEIKYSGLHIYKLYAFGGMGWTTPSNLARWGHAYSMDGSQNCTFPAKVQCFGLDASNQRVTRIATPSVSTDAANKGYVDNQTTNIAKSQLASSVQTSLGKADTALQSIADKSITKAKLADAVTTEIANKQNSTDNTLTTTAKTIAGAINEINTLAKSKASTSVATISANGLMSSVDKIKLDGIAEGANKTVVESELIMGSTNAIANGTVTDKFMQIETEISGLPTTAYVDGAIGSVNERIDDKQDKLVSGTNIKTINGASILGNGNITISGSGGLSPVEVTNGDIDDAVADIEIDSGSIIKFGGKMYHPHYDINTINALKQGTKWPYSAANSILMASCGEALSDNGDFIGMFINKIHWSIRSTGPAIDGMDMLVVWKHTYYDGGVNLYIIERVNY